jgi:hypothetical protein
VENTDRSIEQDSLVDEAVEEKQITVHIILGSGSITKDDQNDEVLVYRPKHRDHVSSVEIRDNASAL